MPTNHKGFKLTNGDATGKQLAVLVPTDYRVLHLASAADEATDWNVANPTHPTFYVHSETTPATDYISFDHDGTDGTMNVAGGDIRLARGGTDVAVISATGTGVLDDMRLAMGTGETARFIWETADANANELLLELPVGGATDVPVLVIGDSLENDDLGQYNGVVSTTVAIHGSTATATGPSLTFKKSRGTNSAPTVVTTGDDMGSVDFYGAVAADEYVRGARILAEMTGTIATTRGPGVLTFQTATDVAPSVLTTAMTITAAQVVTIPVSLLANDDVPVNLGTSSDAVLRWETADANANEMVITLPTGDSTNVPVIAIGQGAGMAGDLGLYNGIVDPKVALLAAGAVTTGPTLEFRKARGTIASPTVVTSGDDIGQIMAYGAVAAGEYVQAASIEFDMAGTIATTRGPGTITFKTATDVAPSVLTTALTISAAQVATFASTVTVQGASATIGVVGATTGSLILAGATSNSVTLKAQDAAGNVTFLLPAAVGSNGEQLTTNGGTPATTSWTAAASLREFKNILRSVNDKAEDALRRVAGANVYEFKYREDAGTSTRDFDTTYRGIVADEYPEVMHYNGRIFNPINAFGELVLAVKALTAKVEALEGVKA